MFSRHIFGFGAKCAGMFMLLDVGWGFIPPHHATTSTPSARGSTSENFGFDTLFSERFGFATILDQAKNRARNNKHIEVIVNVIDNSEQI